MADRALRGSGLGSKSHADPNGVELAPRQEVGFDCPKAVSYTHLDVYKRQLPQRRVMIVSMDDPSPQQSGQ